MSIDAYTARRLQGEIKNLERDREAYYQVVQDEEKPLIFYFLLRGESNKNSPYRGGYYLGKIVLPKDYPRNPGDFYMLTPSGRFKPEAKICLTNSSWHKETWSPIWNIQTMVVGFVSVFGDDSTSGVAHIKESPFQRMEKAKNSMKYNMDNFKNIVMKFDQFVKPDGTVRTDEEVLAFVKELRDKKKSKKERKKEKREKKKSKSKSKSKEKEKKGVLKKIVKVKDDNDEDDEDDNDNNNDDNNNDNNNKEEVEQEGKRTDATEQDNNHLESDENKSSEDNEENANEKDEEIEIEEEEVVEDEPKVTKNVTTKKVSNKAPSKATKTTGKAKQPVKQSNPMSNIRVVKKSKPKSFDEWLEQVKNMTIETHDQELLNMVFD